MSGRHVASLAETGQQVGSDVHLVERDGLFLAVAADVLLDVVQADALDVIDVDLVQRGVQLGGPTSIRFANLDVLQELG